MVLTGAKVATVFGLFLSWNLQAGSREELPPLPVMRPGSLEYASHISCRQRLEYYGVLSNRRFNDRAAKEDTVAAELLKDELHQDRAFYAASVLAHLRNTLQGRPIQVPSRNPVHGDREPLVFQQTPGGMLRTALIQGDDLALFGLPVHTLILRNRDPKGAQAFEAIKRLERLYRDVGMVLNYLFWWRQMWLLRTGESPSAHFPTWFRDRKAREREMPPFEGLFPPSPENSPTEELLLDVTGLLEEDLRRRDKPTYLILDVADRQTDVESWNVEVKHHPWLPNEVHSHLRYLSATFLRMPHLLRSSVFQTLLKRIQESMTALDEATKGAITPNRRRASRNGSEPNAVRISE